MPKTSSILAFLPQSPIIKDPSLGIRPLLFEYYNDGAIEYAMAGTGFLAIIEETLLFITAYHAENGGAEMLRVPVQNGGQFVVKLKERFTAKWHEDENTDQIDITFFTLDPQNAVEEYDLRAVAIQTMRESSIETFIEKWKMAGLNLTDATFLSTGFPKDHQEVHPRLIARPKTVKLKYRGPSIIIGSYEVDWDMNSVVNPDGMSGSPVFIKLKEDQYVFIGMALRASAGLGHLISGGLIAELVKKALTADTI